MRFYRDPITNFWGNMAHFSYFWFLIVEKAKLNPALLWASQTIYEQLKFSKYFWIFFDLTQATHLAVKARPNARNISMQHLSTLLHTFGHVWQTFGHPTATCCNMLDGFGLSSGYCKMLRTLGQFLHSISQHDPTLLQDVTLKCCVRLSCSAHFHFVFWISFPMNVLQMHRLWKTSDSRISRQTTMCS